MENLNDEIWNLTVQEKAARKQMRDLQAEKFLENEERKRQAANKRMEVWRQKEEKRKQREEAWEQKVQLREQKMQLQEQKRQLKEQKEQELEEKRQLREQKEQELQQKRQLRLQKEQEQQQKKHQKELKRKIEEQKEKEREQRKTLVRDKTYRQLKNSVKLEVSYTQATFKINNPGFLFLEEFFRGIKPKLPPLENKNVKFILHTNTNSFETSSPYETLPSIFREQMTEKDFESILSLEIVVS